jgi:hypothetical protein
LLRVLGLGADPDLRPLVFHGSTFRQLVRTTQENLESS